MSPSPCTGSGRAQIRRSPAEYESAGLAVIERDAPDLPDHPARPPVASPASWLAARTACLDAPSDPIPHFRRSKCQLCTPRLRCGTSLFGDLGRESSGPRLGPQEVPRLSTGSARLLHREVTTTSRTVLHLRRAASPAGRPPRLAPGGHKGVVLDPIPHSRRSECGICTV